MKSLTERDPMQAAAEVQTPCARRPLSEICGASVRESLEADSQIEPVPHEHHCDSAARASTVCIKRGHCLCRCGATLGLDLFAQWSANA